MNSRDMKLALKEKVGYALGDTAANIAWRPLIAFLPIFYTDTVGLSLSAVTTLLLVARFSDGITDVIMGTIADRTETKWGKFRPWILWTAIPFGLMLALTFTNPKMGSVGNLIWAYATYIVLTLLYTANNVPYSALMGVMSPNIGERTKISSFRFFGAYGGGAIVMGLMVPLVAFLGGGNESKGYQYAFYVFAAMLSIFSFITFFSTRERVKPSLNQKTNLKSDFGDLLTNRPWLILLVIGFLFVAYNSIKQGIAMYYFTHYIGNMALGGSYLLSLVLISMGATFLTPWLVRMFGKKTCFSIVLVFSGVVNSLLYFAQPGDVVYVFVVGNISEIGAAIMPVLFFSMLGDSADYSEWKNGRRATGLIFSAGTFAMKFGGGVAAAVMLLVLNWYGYVEQPEGVLEKIQQSPSALEGIRLDMSVVPLVFIVASVILMAFYPLSKKRMEEIEKDLSKRRSEVGTEKVAELVG